MVIESCDPCCIRNVCRLAKRRARDLALREGGRRGPPSSGKCRPDVLLIIKKRRKSMRTILSTMLLSGLLFAATTAVAESTKDGASSRLLTPQNSAVILIDHQPQMAIATHSIDTLSLINKLTRLAKAA